VLDRRVDLLKQVEASVTGKIDGAGRAANQEPRLHHVHVKLFRVRLFDAMDGNLDPGLFIIRE
jgi:hypothetical protein